MNNFLTSLGVWTNTGEWKLTRMAKCFNPGLPRIVEETESYGGQVTASKPTVPTVQKVSWTESSISQEWLKRMSLVKTSVFAIKPGINQIKINTKDMQISTTQYTSRQFKSGRKSQSLDGLRGQSALTELKERAKISSLNRPSSVKSLNIEDTNRRKPDSTYICLLNGIT